MVSRQMTYKHMDALVIYCLVDGPWIVLTTLKSHLPLKVVLISPAMQLDESEHFIHIY